MKALHAVLVALVAAVTLASVAAAGPDAAKQRVAIDVKFYPQETFVLTPLQAGPLKRDTGKISESLTSVRGHDVMRDGQKVTIYDGGVITLTGRHRHGDLEGHARDRPVRRDRREGAECPHRPR